VARTRFALARALGDDPAQRTRAFSLASSARDDYAHGGDRDATFRTEVEAWLARHAPR
jgi:hypothetical protein